MKKLSEIEHEELEYDSMYNEFKVVFPSREINSIPTDLLIDTDGFTEKCYLEQVEFQGGNMGYECIYFPYRENKVKTTTYLNKLK